MEEVIHRALEDQDALESWLHENQGEIEVKIARGIAQLDGGEGIPGDVARQRLQERKRAGRAKLLVNEYLVSPEAHEDLFQIWSYLAINGSEEIANRIESEIYEVLQTLARMPSIYEYIIVYRPKTKVEIVAVLHGTRNVKRLLKQRT